MLLGLTDAVPVKAMSLTKVSSKTRALAFWRSACIYLCLYAESLLRTDSIVIWLSSRLTKIL